MIVSKYSVIHMKSWKAIHKTPTFYHKTRHVKQTTHHQSNSSTFYKHSTENTDDSLF